MSKDGYVVTHCILTINEMRVSDTRLLLCFSGGALVSIEDPQEGFFIQQNLELLQDVTKSFWNGLYKNHDGEVKCDIKHKSSVISLLSSLWSHLVKRTFCLL